MKYENIFSGTHIDKYCVKDASVKYSITNGRDGVDVEKSYTLQVLEPSSSKLQWEEYYNYKKNDIKLTVFDSRGKTLASFPDEEDPSRRWIELPEPDANAEIKFDVKFPSALKRFYEISNCKYLYSLLLYSPGFIFPVNVKSFSFEFSFPVKMAKLVVDTSTRGTVNEQPGKPGFSFSLDWQNLPAYTYCSEPIVVATGLPPTLIKVGAALGCSVLGSAIWNAIS